MSSIGLNDPHITMVYDAIVHNDPLRWFLLGFDNRPTELQVLASGVGDVDELRSKVKPDHICYGVFREPGRGGTLRLSVNYIPDSIRGVHRARALVNGKTVAKRFNSHEQLTVSDPEQISVQAVRAVLRLPPRQSQVSTSPDGDNTVLTSSPPRRNGTPHRKPIPELNPPSPRLPNEPALRPTSIETSPIPLTLSVDPSSTHLDIPEKDENSAYAEDAFAESNEATMANPELPIDGRPPSLPPQSTTSPLSPGVFDFIHGNMPSSMMHALPPREPAPTSPTVPEPVTPSWLAKQAAPLPSWLAKQAAPLPSPPDEAEESDAPSSQGKSDASWNRPASPDIVSIPDSPSVRSIQSYEHDTSPPDRQTAVEGLPTAGPKLLAEEQVEQRGSRSIDGMPKTLPSLPSKPATTPMSPSPAPVSISSPPRSGSSSVRQSYDKPLPPQKQPESPTISPPQRTSSRFYTQPQSAGQDTPTSSAQETPSSFRMSPPERTSSRFHRRNISTEQEEEERKLVVLEEERRRRQAERARREKEEREEEEARERAFAERKEAERLKRIENARKAEEKRLEMLRLQEEEAARRQAEKLKKEEETLRRRKDIGERIVQQAGMDLMSGFITLETGSSWKRRFYRLSTEQWVFYKNDQDTTPVHILDLSQIAALKEWSEGYEELEAIPNSFAVELRDDSPWLFFADSSEDKEIILGLLNQAAGL
ncbi:hypothetical protein M422DRAFT_24036 [Sphaerobolus stellatus SS14]|nr:hypothetical protein M422DRAFT_24036 [Sphaerobolus stellatus SS14]